MLVRRSPLSMLVGCLAGAVLFVAACSDADPNQLDGRAPASGPARGDLASGEDPAGGPGSPTTGAPAAAPPPGPPGDGGSAADSGAAASGRQRNLDDINARRAAAGVAPLVLDAALTTFAQAGSVQLSTDHSPHAHFIAAGQAGTLGAAGFRGGGAENQGAPSGWTPMAADATQNERLQIDAIIAAMYAEGPGTGDAHGHYNNLMNGAYTRLGVGLVTISGKLYLTNDFSP